MSTPEGSSSTPLSSPNNEASSEPTVAVDATLDDVEIVDVDDGTEKEREVVPGSRKYSSEAWLHFTQITSGGKVIKAKCKNCKTILKAESRNGTNGMKQHAAKCKKRLVASGSGMSMRQKVLTSNFMNDGKKTLDTYAFDHEFARRQLACMIILHEYPLSMVEHIGFRRYSQSLQSMIDKITKGYCCDLLNEYQQKLGQSGGDESLCHESSSMVEDSLSDYDKFVESRKKQKVYNVKSEMDHYLEEDVLPRARHGEREPFDILAWWKSNGLKYPTLQAMARDILAIPITTVAFESAFSTGGRVISPHRNRLHPKTLESLMCAQSWLLALQEGDNREGFGTMNDEEEDDFELSEISTVTV